MTSLPLEGSATTPTARLPEPLLAPIAERFRALGEPMRIRILERLRTGEATVGDLAGAIGSTPQNVSKHLRLLQSLGMVSRRRQGGFSHYAINDDSVLRMCDEVCGSLRRRVAELNELICEGVGR